MQLSNNFTLAELTASSTAVKYDVANTPNHAQTVNLRDLCVHVLQPVRNIYGKPIIINNGFRSVALNSAMAKEGYKVSATSQHMSGEAADIRAQNKAENKALFDVIFRRGIFDQLIWEDGNNDYPDWIHVSCKTSGNRKQALRMKNGSTTHKNYDLIKWSA
jgi:hypothetical protein